MPTCPCSQRLHNHPTLVLGIVWYLHTLLHEERWLQHTVSLAREWNQRAKGMRLKDSHEPEGEASASLQHVAGINLMHVDVVAKPTALRRQALFMLANFSRGLVSQPAAVAGGFEPRLAA